MPKRTRIDGMKEIERLFKRLGKVPQPVVNRAAKFGGQIALKSAIQNAPEDTGALKRKPSIET
jgi:hypothetical protein